jgi:radical SAM protein with 4Fe4S-binding SPASM domain
MPAGVQVEQRESLFLLLHPHAPRWAIVNRTGLEVARQVDGQRSIPQIAGSLARRYGQDTALVEPQVRACLAELHRAGFLSGVSAPPAPEKRLWRLHLYLTEDCNLACRHCGVVDGSRPGGELNSRAVRRLIDQAVATGVDGIAFSGGEPLLRADCLDLLGYAARRVKTLLSTNGTLLDEASAAALVALGVVVQVSLDGATAAVHDALRGSGAFERAWRGIEHLQRAGIGERLALNVTLLRPNLPQVAEIVALAARRGVAGVRFAPVQRLGRAATRWPELAPGAGDYAPVYRLLYRTLDAGKVTVGKGLPGLEMEPLEGQPWCRLGHLLLVDSRGDIYPCSLLTAPQFRLGNVAHTPLAEALGSDRLRGLAALCAGRKDEIDDCRACAWRHFCQASCPGSVWLEQGTFYAADALCDLRRELYRDLIFEGVDLID